MRERPQPASAPSELVTPVTASAASSAARARSIKISALGSSGSSMSRLGQSRAISAGSARPQNGSSGTVRAIATARSTSSSSAFGERSLDETIACCRPMNTLQPQILAFRAFELLGLAETAGMRQRDALEHHRVGGVGPGAARAPDQVLQQVDRGARFLVDFTP